MVDLKAGEVGCIILIAIYFAGSIIRIGQLAVSRNCMKSVSPEVVRTIDQTSQTSVIAADTRFGLMTDENTKGEHTSLRIRRTTERPRIDLLKVATEPITSIKRF